MKMEREITARFPASVRTAWRDPQRTYPLVGKEAASIAQAVPARQAEFSAGRDAARAALDMPDQEILRDTSRAPIWPEGWCGSISHSRTLCLAAVAPITDYAGLGVDLEPDVPLPDDLLAMVLREEESGVRAAQAIAVFSMKEAVYKALAPQLSNILSFHDLRIDAGEGGTGYNAVLCCDAGPFAAGDSFAVSSQTYQAHVLSLCCLPRKPLSC